MPELYGPGASNAVRLISKILGHEDWLLISRGDAPQSAYTLSPMKPEAQSAVIKNIAQTNDGDWKVETFRGEGN